MKISRDRMSGIAASAVLMLMLSIAMPIQSAYAHASVQIQNVDFSYTMIYAGQYIRPGDLVTISVKLQLTSGGQATFNVCPEQRVQYQGGGFGDNYGLACSEITLGGSWGLGSTSGTVSMQRMPIVSSAGTLQYKIHIFDAAGSHVGQGVAYTEWRSVILVASTGLS